jgi:cystathionine beta-lyase/cystathionine gamma-synthase
MRQHDVNGRAIARWLVEQIGAESVLYVGLPTHPQHELAKRQMSGYGGMISIELGTKERANHLLKRVRVFSMAESLGGVESLISHPATMTHASVEPAQRAQLGITDGLVRLSCGVEETEDLIADLEQALTGVPREAGGGRREAVAAR